MMRTIVFDLDGTLVDTAPDLISALNLVLSREGLPPVGYDHARRMMGGGSRRMIERALIAEGHSVPGAELDRIFRGFIDHYGAHIADRSRPFPRLESMLKRLTAEGLRLAVCTNKLERLAVRLLDALKLSSYFAAICGQDTFGMQKPDPQMLRLIIRRTGGELHRAVMVGDSRTDVRTARAANVPVIAVDFGYSEVPVATLHPDRVTAHLPNCRPHSRQLSGNIRPLLPRQWRRL